MIATRVLGWALRCLLAQSNSGQGYLGAARRNRVLDRASRCLMAQGHFGRRQGYCEAVRGDRVLGWALRCLRAQSHCGRQGCCEAARRADQAGSSCYCLVERGPLPQPRARDQPCLRACVGGFNGREAISNSYKSVFFLLWVGVATTWHRLTQGCCLYYCDPKPPRLFAE